MALLQRLRRLSLPEAVDVPTDLGSLLYPADCQTITPEVEREGRWDPSDAEALERGLRPGMHVLNLGAHVGYFTLLASASIGPAGRVTAIEAAPDNFALLRANIRRRRARNVRAIHAAAWRSSGTLELSLSPTNTGDHRAYAYAGARGRVPVPALAVDDLLGASEPLDFVFADTQGTEHVAVAGMLRTIRRCRPAMLLEFWPQGIRELGDDPEAVLRSYRELGYELDVVGRELGAGASESALVAAAEPDGPGGFGTLSLDPRPL